MGRQAFTTVEKAFVAEAERAFGFLASDFDLAGPQRVGVATQGVAFVGPDVRYRVFLDPDDKAVITRVDVEVGDIRLVAELDDLVVAAGLRPRQHVPRSARTLHGLRRSLAGQAELVRLLVPLLIPPHSIELMQQANARKWRIT